MKRQPATILIVDDEPSIAEIMQDILESRGYRVLAATILEQALALLREDPQPIDLLLTDVVMPQMSGVELARLVQERWPACRVILMSAYSPQDLASQGLPAELVVLNKPIGIPALIDAVGIALGPEVSDDV